MIVFLNMAIAIMGDIFAQAMEQKPMNTRLSEINSLADYVNVIGNEKAKTFRGRKSVVKNSNAQGGPSADKNYMLLYAVETDRESMFDEGAGWEGQVNIIKKFTETKINQAHDSLMINNMKLLEHQTESELKNMMQERELKMSISKLQNEMKSIVSIEGKINKLLDKQNIGTSEKREQGRVLEYVPCADVVSEVSADEEQDPMIGTFYNHKGGRLSTTGSRLGLS